MIHKHSARIELFIDRGTGSEDENLAELESLIRNRTEIERAFGDELDWQQLEGKRACRIAYELAGHGYRDVEQWESTAGLMIDAMTRFSDSVRPYIDKLEV